MKTPEEIAADEAAKVATDKAAAEKKTAVKVRIIGEHPDHAVNDVVKMAPEAVEAAEKAGWADSDKAAVAYAEGLKRASRDD